MLQSMKDPTKPAQPKSSCQAAFEQLVQGISTSGMPAMTGAVQDFKNRCLRNPGGLSGAAVAKKRKAAAARKKKKALGEGGSPPAED
jgi:hypothetical protein